MPPVQKHTLEQQAVNAALKTFSALYRSAYRMSCHPRKTTNFMAKLKTIIGKVVQTVDPELATAWADLPMMSDEEAHADLHTRRMKLAVQYAEWVFENRIGRDEPPSPGILTSNFFLNKFLYQAMPKPDVVPSWGEKSRSSRESSGSVYDSWKKHRDV